MVGTITYNPAANTIAAVGGTVQTPIGFVDLWNADKAGTLNNAARTGITGVDGANVALAYNLRPADEVLLGGAKGDLYIAVSNWSNMTSAAVDIVGTDENGAALTETIAVTGNGNFYVTRLFRSGTHSKVSAFVGAGSFDYTVTQGQWGVVWRQAANQYAFDCKIVVGDGSTTTHFSDKRKQIHFSNLGATTYIEIKAQASFTLGKLEDAATKWTSGSCSIYLSDVIGTTYIIYNSGTTNLYSASLHGSISSPLTTLVSYGTLSVYNSILYKVGIFGGGAGTMNIYRLTSVEASYGFWSLGVGIPEDVLMYHPGYVVFEIYSTTRTIKNLVAKNVATLVRIQNSNPTIALLNPDVDAWTFLWVNCPTAKVYRQYEFDLTATDKEGNPLEAAAVTLADKDGAVVFTATTGANGAIATQTVSRGYYQQSTGNALQEYSPHTLTIAKAGYQTYVKKFVLAEKTRWTVKLAKAQTILLDCGGLVLNLAAAEPENKHVLEFRLGA